MVFLLDCGHLPRPRLPAALDLRDANTEAGLEELPVGDSALGRDGDAVAVVEVLAPPE